MTHPHVSVFLNINKDYHSLQKIQEKKLRFLANYAYNKVAYYNKVFKIYDIKPNNIRTLGDIKKIPILNRMDIVKNYPQSIVSKSFNVKKCYERSTSGSSGIPITVAFDNFSVRNYELIGIRSLLLTGHKILDRIAYIWYPPFRKDRLYERLGILKKTYISVDNTPELILEKLAKINYKTIYCYPSVLFEIAKKLDNSNYKIKPKRIITQGELLTKEVRKFIEEKFDCKTFNHYGTTEFYIIASECRYHDGMHVNMDNLIVEIKNKDGNTSIDYGKGSFIITGLTNKAMPLIRYEIGDIGSIKNEKCNCGLEFPKIDLFEGRNDDFIQLPSGKIIGPRKIATNLYKIFTFTNKIEKYRIVQNMTEKFIVDIVPGNKFNENVITEFKNILQKVLEEPVTIKIKIKKNIPKNLHGKLRSIESKVKIRE